MNKELQSEILNRNAKGVKTTILLAKTNKEKKANVYNIYVLGDNNEIILLAHSVNLTPVKNALWLDSLSNIHELSYWLFGYRLDHIRFVNLSE